MILTSLLVGAIVGAGVFLAVFWKDIVNWIKRIWENLPQSVKDNLQGAMAFVKRIGNTVLNIMKYYAYNKTKNQWTETIVEKECSEADVPEHIRAKLKQHSEVDITDETEETLKMSLS